MGSSYEQIDNDKMKSFEINKYDLKSSCPHIQLHFHDTYEIVYVKNGRGKVRAEDKEYFYEDGVLVFIGPNVPHYGLINRELDDNYEVVIHFDDNFVLKKLKVFPELEALTQFILSSQNILIFDPSFMKDLAPYFESMVNKEKEEQLLLLMRIVFEMCKTELHFNLLTNTKRFYQQDAKQLKQILSFINENFESNTSTKDAAQYLNMTVNSFCRLFKKISDKAFMDYLNEFRIHNAVYLLECGGLTISEIMYKSGFANPSYFTKQFRKYKTASPSEYRRQYHDKMNNERQRDES